ncbi:helix-turn-helix transcriptional regulator [Streptomyces sp. AV19]|uniref:helix-turn-helix domain-containing protein n=1 Tax=Streptomyces sp. AV19 TaxID=2793068 RepID=UPI0018FF0FF8|nr:helix-turn-helix transcriptional regulator [Streptomyces sp. AV19]MBH1933416.1 helix-turn-helix transcriptional regulator [Streptomyces sp. AV19]MDG4532047.1 helix-turn-helix domain-containing protein [Streptomyces sp. AV19]
MSALGENVRKHRRLAGLTQEQLAYAAGLAPSTVAKLEQGGNVRIETLHILARALHVRTSQLMASDTPEPVQGEDPTLVGLAELRSALTPPMSITGDSGDGPDEEPNLSVLLEVIRTGSSAYDSDNFGSVAAKMPQMIRDANSAVAYFDNGEERRKALSARAEAYLLGGRYLTQVRQYDLAYHALSGAIQDARTVQDMNTAGYAVVIMSWLLLRQGRFDDAERAAIETADHLEPRISKAPPERLAVWGWLALQAAAAAVRNNRPDDSADARRIAESAAAALGRHADAGHRFGRFDSAVAGMKGLEDELISENGDPCRVIYESTGNARFSDHAMKAARIAETDKEWNRHRLTVATAYVKVGDHEKALDRLTAVEYANPQWLRHQRMAQDVMAAIVRRRKRKLTPGMRAMATRLGVLG